MPANHWVGTYDKAVAIIYAGGRSVHGSEIIEIEIIENTIEKLHTQS